MKIGYPCINRSLDCRTDQTFRLASYTPERFLSTVQSNLNGLMQVLEYNLQNKFMFFRISSETIPFASHPVCQIDWAKHFQKDFQKIGAFIRQNNMRISMHPDQFVLINAKNPEIVQKSIADLLWHSQFLDALGLSTDAKVQIHVGGVYGDKPSAIERFVENYRALPALIKRRLVIEHDDRLFSLADCLTIHEQTGVPILFDSFHHACLNGGESLRDALGSAAQTWKPTDGCLMVDYSSQQKGARLGKHAESIDVADFQLFLKAAHKIPCDVMLEIKDKEKSALKAIACKLS